MAAEIIPYPLRVTATPQGRAVANANPNARATFVPLPTYAAGQAAKAPAKVAAVLAPNARQSRV